jgi:hypothetical protein
MRAHPREETEILIRQAAAPYKLEKEYYFFRPRRWRFDWAIPVFYLAFEYEGLSQKSRHTTLVGYSNDCEKYDIAQLLGWRVIRLTPKMLQDGRAGRLIRLPLWLRSRRYTPRELQEADEISYP